MIDNHSYSKRIGRPKLRYIGAFLSLCYIMILFSGCENKQVSIPTLMDPVKVKLDTETASIDNLYNLEVYDASVVPYMEEISPENTFMIDDIKVGIGDRVKKGQVLITMERSALKEAYTDMQEEIDFIRQNNAYTNQQTECDIRVAKLELAQLVKTANEKELQLKKLAIGEMETQYNYVKELQQLELAAKDKALSKLEQKVHYPDILAPYDGTIIYITKVHDGDTIQAFDPIIYIADDSRLSIQSDYISIRSLENAYRLYALIDGKEYDLTNIPYTDEEFKYRLFNELPMKSEFSINDTSANLTVGSYACISIVSNYMENVLTIPKKALYKDGPVTYVYKIVNGERVRNEVEVGRSNKIKIQILSGLKEGDEIYVQQ